MNQSPFCGVGLYMLHISPPSSMPQTGPIVEKIGPVWGMDEGGEMCNMYKPTRQKGLWFIGGGFAQSRVWSHYVALQIKAREAGIVPYEAVGERPVLDTLTGPPRPYRDAVTPGDDAGAGAGTDGL